MAVIRVRCPQCGPTQVRSDDIDLVSVPGRPVDRGNTHYTFTCRVCGTFVRRPADRITADVLTSAGVPMHPPRHPVFLGHDTHPEDPPGGPAFTPDDVLDLHLLLARDDWFTVLLAAHPDTWR